MAFFCCIITRINIRDGFESVLNLFDTVAERAQRAANRKKNTCKLRKHFRQFDNTHAANAYNTTKKRNALQIKCICLCCEHLQCVSLFVCVVSICSAFLYLFVL